MDHEVYRKLKSAPRDNLLLRQLMQLMNGNLKPFVTSEMLERCTNKEEVIMGQIRLNEKNTSPSVESMNYRAATEDLLDSYSKEREVELRPENRVGITTLMKHVDHVLLGKFFLCRTLTPASKDIGLETAVDDPEAERAVKLSLYNYSAAAEVGVTDFNDVLPVGMILAVKNPWFKSTGKKGLAVRCDNPGDVELISPMKLIQLFPGLVWKTDVPFEIKVHNLPFWGVAGETDLQIAEVLNEVGNRSFVQKRFSDAIRWYNLCLEYVHGDGNVKVLSNKAAALINLGCYNQALKCTDKILAAEPYHVKCVFRKAKALSGLQRFQEAVEFLDKKFSEDQNVKDNKDLEKLRAELLSLLQQNASGPTDSQTAKLEISYITGKIIGTDDIADYTGPVEIKQVKGKGRGLVATMDIQPGQFILCSKAFEIFLCDEQSREACRSMEFELKSANVKLGHHKVVEKIANKLSFDPELGREIFKLTAGAEFTALKDDEAYTKVDMKRIDRIVDINAFACTWPKADEDRGCGVWVLPSLINHSCSEANSCSNIYGELMIVRSVKFIKKGEEILMPYISPATPFEERNEIFTAHGFQCDCKLCELESKESSNIVYRRKKIIEKLESEQENNKDIYFIKPDALSRALEDISELESMRKQSPHLNIILLDSTAIMNVTLTLFELGRFQECATLLEKMHYVANSLAVMIDNGYQIPVNITECYICMKEETLVRKWIKEIKRMVMVAFGSIEPLRVSAPTLIMHVAAYLGIDFFSSDC